MTSGSPTLPGELEREIFELCALSRPVCIPKLMLVAQRVKEWVEPLLYRAIILGHPTQITGLPSFTDMSSVIRRLEPPVSFSSAVRHLILFPPLDVKAMLVLCTNVESLWLFEIDAPLIPLVRALPLKRLTTDLYWSLPSPNIFPHLTHLHLGGYPIKDDVRSICAFLMALPQLTHLAFDDDFLVPVARKMLELSRAIHVLVFFSEPFSYPRVWDPEAASGQPAWDVRFVLMPRRNMVEDWCAGVQRGTDCWSDAETFVAVKRRLPELDALHYVWKRANPEHPAHS
ncbi:hypothetical protein B0H14DRAFT_3447137 [Mycena olivaceomarginata]|nr:hypothetical protein B0H14DRAFT_3447137 [Mycena olivaceomarginata]